MNYKCAHSLITTSRQPQWPTVHVVLSVTDHCEWTTGCWGCQQVCSILYACYDLKGELMLWAAHRWIQKSASSQGLADLRFIYSLSHSRGVALMSDFSWTGLLVNIFSYSTRSQWAAELNSELISVFWQWRRPHCPNIIIQQAAFQPLLRIRGWGHPFSFFSWWAYWLI